MENDPTLRIFHMLRNFLISLIQTGTHITILGSDSLISVATVYTTVIPPTSYFSALKLKVFLVTVARQNLLG